MRGRPSCAGHVPVFKSRKPICAGVQIFHVQALTILVKLCALIRITAVVREQIHEVLCTAKTSPGSIRTGYGSRNGRGTMYQISCATVSLCVCAIVINGKNKFIRI